LNLEPAGEPLALVVVLYQTSDNRWLVRLECEGGLDVYALRPATWVVRAWRSRDGQLLRGRLLLDGSEPGAPFQANDDICVLLKRWLVVSTDDISGPPGPDQEEHDGQAAGV
jgi:hypothetical protein